MTAGELIALLSELDPNTDIILQKDAEGNGYSPLYATDLGYYVPDSTWSGEFYDISYSAEDCDMEQDEWEAMRAEHPVSFVLAPVN